MEFYPQTSPTLGSEAVDLTTGPQCTVFGVHCAYQIWTTDSLGENDLLETNLKPIDDTIRVTDPSTFCYSYV